MAFILAIIMIVSVFVTIPFAAEVESADAYGAVALETGAFGAAVSGSGSSGSSDELDNEDLQRLAAYMKFIKENFKDDFAYDILVDGAFNGVTEALGDPFSVYYPAAEDEEEFTSQVEGTFEGIGVSITMGVDGKCVVDHPLSGSPAMEAGVKAGDVIVRIDGKSVEGWTLNEISSNLRGEKGTVVKVTVKRGDAEMSFDITRDTIKEECLSFEILEDNIGYISMTGFDSDASFEFKIAKLALTNKGAESIILDLRGNPGGYVDQALDIADQILESGYISHFRSQGEITKSYEAKAIDKVYQPLVVLVDGDTASSSEILTAALKDNDAATIVGETTYGKGIAQQIVQIGDGKSAKLSTFYFLTPDKNEIQGVGIEPDVLVHNMTAAELIEAQAAYAGCAPMSEARKPGLGETGLNVYGAQQRLALLGYDVPVTGTCDEVTFQAIKDFQKSAGLWAYGVLDFTTAGRLDAAASAYARGEAVADNQLLKAIEIAKTL